LVNLVDEIEVLRLPISDSTQKPLGNIAKTMFNAAHYYSGSTFITPMICVAGAVADFIMKALLKGRRLLRAQVNNGGDIALYLAPQQSFDIGICTDINQPNINAKFRIFSHQSIRGIATSGCAGRSFSLGIADSVTVLAATAVDADVVATLIANAIDLPGSPKVKRVPANKLFPDSDLGQKKVTVKTAALSSDDIKKALARGLDLATKIIADGGVKAVFASLQGEIFSIGSQPIINDLTKEALYA
jgi:ApbE superfamily uncharacterized protein (UPF0280 family)